MLFAWYCRPPPTTEILRMWPFSSRKPRPSAMKRPHRTSSQPRLEALEDRLAPATLTVNSPADNTADTSVLTLREAITLVNNGGDPTSLGQASMPAGWASQIDT